MSITIQEIANKMGVSPSTVSAALSDSCVSQRVSKIKIEKIRKVAEKLGYRPNLSARRLRTGKTCSVGILVPSFLGHHPLTIYFQLISRLLQSNGYSPVPLATERKLNKVVEQLDFFESHHVDGLIVLDYFTSLYDQYIKLWQSNLPMVFRILDPSLANVPFDNVTVDHYSAGKELIVHLVSQGWTDIYFVSESISNGQDIELVQDLPLNGFFRGWRDGIFEMGLKPFNSANLILFKDRNGTNKYKSVKSFFANRTIQKGKTAFVLDGSDGASAVYAAIQEAGFLIGKDIAVAGMNVLPNNEFVSPLLTVMIEPYEKIAEVLVEKLLKSIQQHESALTQSSCHFNCKLEATASSSRVLC